MGSTLLFTLFNFLKEGIFFVYFESFDMPV